MSFHIRFFSLINKNRVVKSVTEKDANLIILRLTPLVVPNKNGFLYAMKYNIYDSPNEHDPDQIQFGFTRQQ